MLLSFLPANYLDAPGTPGVSPRIVIGFPITTTAYGEDARNARLREVPLRAGLVPRLPCGLRIPGALPTGNRNEDTASSMGAHFVDPGAIQVVASRPQGQYSRGVLPAQREKPLAAESGSNILAAIDTFAFAPSTPTEQTPRGSP